MIQRTYDRFEKVIEEIEKVVSDEKVDTDDNGGQEALYLKQLKLMQHIQIQKKVLGDIIEQKDNVRRRLYSLSAVKQDFVKRDWHEQPKDTDELWS